MSLLSTAISWVSCCAFRFKRCDAAMKFHNLGRRWNFKGWSGCQVSPKSFAGRNLELQWVIALMTGPGILLGLLVLRPRFRHYRRRFKNEDVQEINANYA